MIRTPASRLLSALLLSLAGPTLAHAAGRADAPPAWSIDTNGGFVTAVARRDGVWFVATQDKGFWRSDGATWVKVGLPEDDSVRALAVDRQDRLWVGHGRHGVSVFDGANWHNYDAPNGPLGHRVFRIVVSPTDGDVWLATDLGLTRYSVQSDTWTTFTRLNGLPSDQISAIAFDPHGTIFVGTQCDGLCVAKPDDRYATWTTIDGPVREPTTPTGDGLPSPLVNDVLATRDGKVYVATDAGLAVSGDGGKTFAYVRGLDYVDKVNNRTGGAPADWEGDPKAARLIEDCVTSLAEDGAGRVWVGYGRSGFAPFDPSKTPDPHAITAETGGVPPAEQETPPGQTVAPPLPAAPAIDAVRFIDFIGGRRVVGAWGGGLAVADVEKNADAPPAPRPLTGSLPSARGFPSDLCETLLAAVQNAKREPLTAVYLGDDWVTRGDGCGRYGWQKTFFPFYGLGGWAGGYDVQVSVGPHTTQGGPFYYFDDTTNENDRVLYVPNAFKRAQGEWNDGSFDRKACPAAQEGPDLWFSVEVPDGVHRLSLYFVNFDGLRKSNRFRDYLIEVKPFGDSKEAADFAPALARARVCDFYEPVYKQFLLAKGKYWVKVNRNHSFVAKANGLFLDRMAGPAPQDVDKLPNPLLDADHWGPPPLDRPADPNATVRSTLALWDELNARYEDAAVAPMQLPFRAQLFGLANQDGLPESMTGHFRWHLHEWTEDDRVEFARQMDAGYDKTSTGRTPPADEKPRTRMEDAVKGQVP